MDVDIVVIGSNSEQSIITVAEVEGELYVAVEFQPEIDTDHPDMSKDYISMTEDILQMIRGNNTLNIKIHEN